MITRLSSRVAAAAAAGAVALGLAAAAAAPAQAATAAPAVHAVRTSPWLTGSELPLFSAFHWKAEPGTEYTTTGEFQWLYSCGVGDPTTELRTSSVSVMQFGTTKRVDAAQLLFHFRSTALAKAALARIEHDYTGCAARLDEQQSTDLDSGRPLHWSVTRTAADAGGVGYRVTGRDSAGRLASTPDLFSDAQELFAQNGATISMISIDAESATIDNAVGAAGTLRTMGYRLSHA
jgi:hypothetical protein